MNLTCHRLKFSTTCLRDIAQLSDAVTFTLTDSEKDDLNFDDCAMPHVRQDSDRSQTGAGNLTHGAGLCSPQFGS